MIYTLNNNNSMNENRRARRMANIIAKFEKEKEGMTKAEIKKIDDFFKVLDEQIPKTIPEIRREIREKFSKIKEDKRNKERIAIEKKEKKKEDN